MSLPSSAPQAMLTSGIARANMIAAVPITPVFDISQNVSQTREHAGKVAPTTPLVSPPVVHSCMAPNAEAVHLSPPPVTDRSFRSFEGNPFMSPASSVVEPPSDEIRLSLQAPLFSDNSPPEKWTPRTYQLDNDSHASLNRAVASPYYTQSQILSPRLDNFQFIGSTYNNMFLNGRSAYTTARQLEQQRFRETRAKYQNARHRPAAASATPKRHGSTHHVSSSYSRPLPATRPSTSFGGPLSTDRVKKASISSASGSSAATARSSAVAPPIGTRSTARLLASAHATADKSSSAPALAPPVVPSSPAAEAKAAPSPSPRIRRAIPAGSTRGAAIEGSGVFPIENFPRDSGRRGAVASREDKNFEKLADVCPPISTLDGLKDSALKTEWKGNPINLADDPNLDLLHPLERTLASTLRLDCATYMTSKRRLFLSRLDCLERNKTFRKTDAQNACHIDVNKASRLYVAYDQVGWLKAEWVESFLGKVDLSPVQKTA
ncbi:hypothetical protein BROUX41_004382 [Berkeleyomyces rouxiae]|uniref:uncharacterized protein n=1 Tax=Berkeleyomyces rouxiae TaxID=2035830 RepID=UPI003B7C9135